MKNKKILALVLAVVLLMTATIAGTVAWLTAQTTEVENVFTPSSIGVNLEESTTEYKMIPGFDIAKDPKAWITAGSEEAYLFVKVEEIGVAFTPEDEVMPKVYSFDDFLSYEIADGWTELEEGVYYRKVTAEQIGTAFEILKDNKVTVQGTVTKEMMNDLTTYDVNPTLTFTAYAHQLYKSAGTEFTAAEAWENLNA